ncbi:MAG TPA: hypothetical protein VH061_02310 [Solirubrobacteraceae bacterium]|jgi:hypothetical protein|nr:hypothetical protein [Solirubrobacteraceae bacterium]
MGPIAAIRRYVAEMHVRNLSMIDEDRARLQRNSGNEMAWLEAMVENPSGRQKRSVEPPVRPLPGERTSGQE